MRRWYIRWSRLEIHHQRWAPGPFQWETPFRRHIHVRDWVEHKVWFTAISIWLFKLNSFLSELRLQQTVKTVRQHRKNDEITRGHVHVSPSLFCVFTSEECRGSLGWVLLKITRTVVVWLWSGSLSFSICTKLRCKYCNPSIFLHLNMGRLIFSKAHSQTKWSLYEDAEIL